MSRSRKRNFDLSNADDFAEVMDILASDSLSELSESYSEEDDPDYQPTCMGNAELQFSDAADNSAGKYIEFLLLNSFVNNLLFTKY